MGHLPPEIISFVGGGIVSGYYPNAYISAVKPAAVEGELLVAFVGVSYPDGNILPPVGWEPLVEQQTFGDLLMGAWQHRFSSADLEYYDFQCAVRAESSETGFGMWRISPTVEVTATVTATGLLAANSSSDVTLPSITTVEDNQLEVWGLASLGGVDVDSWSLGGTSQLAFHATSLGISVLSKLIDSAGAVGSSTFRVTGTMDNGIAVLLAISGPATASWYLVKDDGSGDTMVEWDGVTLTPWPDGVTPVQSALTVPSDMQTAGAAVHQVSVASRVSADATVAELIRSHNEMSRWLESMAKALARAGVYYTYPN